MKKMKLYMMKLINVCYRKIIEILSNEEDEDVQKYVGDLQKFIEDYEIKYLKKK